MQKECQTLKEALDVTCEKYNYPKNKEYYKRLLDLIIERNYKYITKDNGAKNYVLDRKRVINEIDVLYNQAEKGQETILNGEKSYNEKAYVVASYFETLTKENNRISFGKVSSKIDSLQMSSEEKGNYIYECMKSNFISNDLTSGDIKRTVIENAYRLLRLHQTRSGNIILDLYSDNESMPINQREQLSNDIYNYLSQKFFGINGDNIVEIVSDFSDEDLNYLSNLYVSVRRNYKNSNYINQADKIDLDKKTIDIFKAFEDKSLAQKLSFNGISY